MRNCKSSKLYNRRTEAIDSRFVWDRCFYESFINELDSVKMQFMGDIKLFRIMDTAVPKIVHELVG